MPKITPRKPLFILLLALFLLALSMPIQPSVSAYAAKADVEYWAVIVGVADYPGTLNDLDYTDDDAYDVRDALLASTNWEASHITLLIDNDATKANIYAAITDMGTSGDADDVFFFFFSGHGKRVLDQPPLDEDDPYDEALCQYDHNNVGPILDDELGIWLSALPGTPVLVAIDTCYSGGMIKAGQGQSRGLLGAGVPASGDGFAKDLEGVIEGVVLTACADTEVSWERDELENGVFTYYFIEGLAGAADTEGNSNGEVSMEEAFGYLDQLVVEYVVDYIQPYYPNAEQHPQMYDNWPGEAILTILIPPGPTGFSATTTSTTQIDLSWTKGDGADKTKIQRKEGSYPADRNDGTEVYFGTGTSKSDTVLIPGTTYYYRAWSYVQGSDQWSDDYAQALATTLTGIEYSVTLDASPRVATITVDGTQSPPQDLPLSFSWDTSTQHDCVIPSIADGDAGTQYVFTSWSDGYPSPSRSFSMIDEGNYTAYYQTQHYLTVTSDYGSPPGEGWYDEGNATQIETDELIGDDGTRYVFLKWTVDGEAKTHNSISITMDAPHTAVTAYKTQHYLTVESDYGDPEGENWYDEGTSAEIETDDIITDDNTRYVFLNWVVDSDEEEADINTSIIMDAPHTAFADYQTQHFLTVTSAYGEEPSGEDWYDEGTTATTGTAEQTVSDDDTDDTQYVFLNWAVDGDDKTVNPVSISMNAPHTAATEYKTQHYLTVNSEYGDPEGQRWYDEGDTTTASVTSPIGGIVRKVFTKWSEDSTATTPSTTIMMDEPKTVTANWRDDYLYVYIIVGGLLVVAGVFSTIVITSKRRRYRRRFTQ